MKVFYFIRHAQPQNDVGSLRLSGFQLDMLGQMDCELSQNGRAQAHAVAPAVKSILNADALISSCMKRAIQTARIISAQTGLEYRDTYLELNELRPGRIKMKVGLVRLLLSNRWPRFLRKGIFEPVIDLVLNLIYLRAWRKGKAEQADDLIEVEQRLDFILGMLVKRKEEKIAIVCHGFLIIFLALKIARLSGQSIWRFLKPGIDNCSVTCIHYEDSCWKLIYFAKNIKQTVLPEK